MTAEQRCRQRNLWKLAYPPSFCALAFHNGWEDRVKTVNDSSTSDKNLIYFGPLIPEFCRHVCAGRATRWALPRVFSLIDLLIDWLTKLIITGLSKNNVAHVSSRHRPS